MDNLFLQKFIAFCEELGVIDYQLLIIFTILLAYLFEDKWFKITRLPRHLNITAVNLVAILWIIETFVLLDNLYFQMKQCLIILIARFVLYLIDRKNTVIRERDKEIYALKKTLEEFDQSDQDKITSVDEDHWCLLEGAKHGNYMIQRLKDIDKKLVLFSAWINTRVTGDSTVFFLELRNALKNEKRVVIGFGWENYDGTHEGSDGEAHLRNLEKEYPEQLSIIKWPSHEKLMVIDEKKVVFGSANWLSNREYRNSERSIEVTSQNLAANEWARIEEKIEQISTSSR